MKAKPLLISVFILISNTVFGQMELENRLEVSFFTKEYSRFHVVPYNEDEFVVIAQLLPEKNKPSTWEVTRYNKEMEVAATAQLTIENPLDDVLLAEIEDDYLYCTFTANPITNTVKRLEKDYTTYSFLRVKMADLSMKKIDGRPVEDKFRGEVSLLAQGELFLAFKDKDEGPYMVKTNFDSGTLTELDLSYGNADPDDVIIDGIQYEPLADQVYAYLIHEKKNKKWFLTSKIFDAQSGEYKTVQNISWGMDKKVRPLQVKMRALSEKEMLYVGAYSSTTVERISGIFYMTRTNGKTSAVKYVKLGEFRSLRDILPGGRWRPYKRKARKPKHKTKTSYRLKTHPLFNVGKDVIYGLELLYPVRSTRNNVSIVGYEHPGVLLARFNERGQKKWDQSIKIKNGSGHNVSPRISSVHSMKGESKGIGVIVPRKSEIQYTILSHERGNIEQSLSFEPGTGTERKSKKAVKTMVLRGDPGELYQMVHWHGKHYLAYGLHKLKGKNKEEVFFVNHYRML